MRTKYEPSASAAPDQDQPPAMMPTTAAICTPQNARDVTRKYPVSGAEVRAVAGGAPAEIVAADADAACMIPRCQLYGHGPSGLRHNRVGHVRRARTRGRAVGKCRTAADYFLQVARMASACCLASGLTGSALKLAFAALAPPQSPFATSAFISS